MGLRQSYDDIFLDVKALTMTRLRPFLISALAFFLALVIGGALINLAERRRRDEQRQTVKDIGIAQAHILENHLNQALSATFALASVLRQRGGIDNFDALAAEMIKNYRGISSLQLAPKGVVTQIYPLAGNETAIGHDLLNDPQRRTEALSAIESRKLTLAGPLTLVQGGMAVIGRLPVFVPDKAGSEKFWGFTIALVRLPDLLKASKLNRLVEQGYSYNISRVYPDEGAEFVFASSMEGILKGAIPSPVEVPNGRWILAIAPRGGWQPSASLPWEIGLVLLVSVLVSVVTYSFTRRREILYEEVEFRTRELSEANRELEAQMVERKRTEERFRRLLEATPDPMIITRQDGMIAFINQQTETAFGYSQDELVGKTIELLVPRRYHPQHVQHRTDYFAHPRTRHMGKGMELYARRKDSSEFPVEISLSAIETEAGVLAASSIRDITERKRAEDELRGRLRFEQLVSLISARFVNVPVRGIDEAVNHGLKLLGEFYNVDRSALMVVSADGKDVRTNNRWVADRTASEGRFRRVFMLAAAEQWRRGEIVVFSRCSEIPEPRKRLREVAVQAVFKSHLSVPLKVGGDFIGAIGITSTTTEREWSGEDIQRIKFVGEIFASALTRKRAEDALQNLSGRLISAQEEERRRLARELHDDVSQRLAVLAIEAGKLEQQSHYTPDFIHGKLQGMKDHIVKLAGDIHRISRQLHPSILDDLGLVDAMESECRRFSDLEGIPVKFTADRFPEGTPKDVSLCLYRVTQESLRNIAKHSKATDARVTLTRKNGSVFLSVEDSGVGFEPAKARVMPGLGLASMEERVRLINGSLSIHSAPGKGTVIEIQAPLASTDRV